MSQINANEILIFGGENLLSAKDTRQSYFASVSEDTLELTFSKGPDLPEPVLPESPGYTLNSNANFYFHGNFSDIFRFNKHDRSWIKIPISTPTDIFAL